MHACSAGSIFLTLKNPAMPLGCSILSLMATHSRQVMAFLHAVDVGGNVVASKSGSLGGGTRIYRSPQFYFHTHVTSQHRFPETTSYACFLILEDGDLPDTGHMPKSAKSTFPTFST
jgi:hypothetical protein